MVLRKGMYRGEAIEKVWSKLLAERGIRTFADIPEGRLRIVATAVDRDPLDFNLTRREAGAMFDHGYATAVRYLDHHPVGA